MNQRSWWIYNLLVAFAFYWLSNVILWYPWSYSTMLGMIIMLTINPIVWGYAIYNCLVRYPGQSLMNQAIICAVAMLVIVVISDFVFFGIIREAMKELYHPTTFYGYMFIFCLPFIEVFVFKKRMLKNRKSLDRSDFVKMIALSTVCIISITSIIVFDLNIV